MSLIKRYKVAHTWNEGMEVELEVHFQILTPERAKEINDFWSCAEDRVLEQNNSFQEAVIRLFGSTAINIMLSEGGASFSGPNSEAAQIWSKQIRELEGWGAEGPENEAASLAPYGWCGIRIVSAEVETASFDQCSLEEQLP